MTGRSVSWPMYGVDPANVEAFWQVLRREMIGAGLDGVPARLTQPEDLAAHWRDPALLLSQTCGYPYITGLSGAVHYVATPRFRAPGCTGASYRSAVIVRRDESASSVAALRGRRVAYNQRDSHSGYNALRALVTPHARGGRFFSEAIETGSHRDSIAAVRTNRADAAAIDAVTLALVGAASAEELEGIRVLGYTDPAPGLPLITSRTTSQADREKLRHALAKACNPDHPAARWLLLDGIEILPRSAYDDIGAMQARALACGYPDLA